MAVMGKKVWAVVCGMVRQEFELYSVLTWLCEQRSKGLIDGIIISTWVGEIDKIPHLRSKLLFLDILAIELPPFDDNADLYYRQAYQLKEAMDVIPDDVFVLKCRTDFCIDLLNQLLPILENKADLSVRTFGNFKSCLRYRIAVGKLGISGPFICEDICFLGYKQDIYKTVIFEDKKLRYSNALAPDLLFFVNVFISDYPLIDDYFKSFKYWAFKIHFTSQFQAFHKDVELPGMLNKFYALYFVLIYTSFFLYNDAGYEKNVANIMDIFGRDLSVIAVGWGTYLKSLKVLDLIIEGNIADTPSNRKFYSEIKKLALPDYAVTNYFTFDDYRETIDFGRKYFDIEPDRWLTPYRKVKNVKVDRNIGFNKSLTILFSDYDIDENFITVIHNIITEKAGKYYGRITDSLNELSKNKKLYEIALFASSRGQDPYILRCIAKMLYNNSINQDNIDMAKFIFLRQSRVPSFFIGKMSADKIAALYYYGKYSEPLNDDTVSKKFYNSLINDFGLSTERKIPASYADAVLELIKEIVSAHFDERMRDPSIHNMVDFLIDDFGKDAFTAEQWEVVGEYALNRIYSLPFKQADDDAFERLLFGAEKVETELEAKIVSKLLLREKWNFSDHAQSADDALSKLIEKYPATVSCFTKANFINEDEILTFSPNELDDNNDFVLFVRILAERKLLTHFKDVFLNIYGNDVFRRMILELFIKLEENEEVKFFSAKGGNDVWIYYNKFSNSRINSELVISRNADRWSWPFADSASPSSYAAFIKVDDDKLFINIEISSCPCTAKTKLLDTLDKTKVNAFNKDDKIIRLRTLSFQFESADNIGEAVESALNNFCEVGELLLKAADEVYK